MLLRNIIGTKNRRKEVAPPNKTLLPKATKDGRNREGNIFLKPNFKIPKVNKKLTTLPTNN